MADIRVWTGVFVSRIGTGVQTVTGVVDQAGNPFTPTHLLFYHTQSVVNTLDWQTAVNNAMVQNWGIATAIQGCSGSYGDIGRFGIKIASTGFAAYYSLLDLEADNFFGGNFQGAGYISAIRAGEFDITWTLQNRGGYSILCTAFGGADLTTTVIQDTTSGAKSTPASPQGLFLVGQTGVMNSSLSAYIGAGGLQYSVGWDTYDGQRSAVAVDLINQSTNSRGQRGDIAVGQVDASSWMNLPRGVVSAWGANGCTLSGGGAAGNSALVLCVRPLVQRPPARLRGHSARVTRTIALGISAKSVVLRTVRMPRPRRH